MTSLYGFYIKEREDFSILEVDGGFITYKITGEDVYIRDLYIVPSERRTRLATTLADEVAEIAKSEGCTKMFGSICPTTKGANESLQVLLAYGFRLANAQSNLILFVKEL